MYQLRSPPLYSLFLLTNSLLIDKLKEMDRDISAVLRDVDVDKWDSMLQEVEVYTEQMRNLTEQLPQRVRQLWPEVEGVLRYGRPRLVTVPVIGSTLRRQFNMSDIQIYRVWVVRHLLGQQYDRFINRMTLMKDNHYLQFLKNTTRSKP